MANINLIENSVPSAYVPLGVDYDNAYAKVISIKPHSITFSSLQERINEGKFFSGSYYNALLADGASIDMLVQVGAVGPISTNVLGFIDGDSLVEVYEGTTISAAGTVISVYNHNRASAKVLDATITHTPTITALGTKISGTYYVPQGQNIEGNSDIGGLNTTFVLAASTKYLFRITNASGFNKKCNITFTGYQPAL